MLWGAFNNASSAMQAYTMDLGSISQNIANVNTNGYKRSEMMFSTVMSEHHAAPSSYVNGLNIFGVQATQRNLIQAQGMLAPSTTWSDLAINGRGFFMIGMPSQGTAPATTIEGAGAGTANVPTQLDVNNPQSIMYSRDGAWHRAYGADTDPDMARSYFLNSSGGYLLGWMADDLGNIPANAKLEPVYTLAPRPIPNNGSAAVDDTSTLRPSSITMPGRATTSAAVRANLPSSVPVSPSTFSSTMTVQDPNTVPPTDQTVTLNWARSTTTPGAWTVTPSVDAALGTVTSPPITVNVDPWGALSEPTALSDAVTVDWLSGPADTTANMLGVTSATTTSAVADPNGIQQSVNLTWTRVNGSNWTVSAAFADPTVGTLDATPVNVELDASGNILSPQRGLQSLGVTWGASYGAAAGATSTQLSLSAPSNVVSAPKLNLQKLSFSVYDDQFVKHDVTLGFEHVGTNEWNLYFDGGTGSDAALGQTPVKVYFNANGSLDTDAGDGTPATTMPLPTTLNWLTGVGNPPVQTPTTATFTLDLSNLTQYNTASVQEGGVDQDGYGKGTLLQTAFTEMGELTGYYDNGKARVLFKVPVATFVSENSLEPVSGTLFRRTAEAGAVTVSGIDEAEGEGRFATSSLEASTVEIEEEFTRMIMTQKAYSMNSQVFKTADEMTTTARDIKS
ncbi:MAG: flagellar hook-basal body complex protein [Magnetospirillum sp.]|nr:flagellar hook-basal body complex protein [Magnetospirillum sp.]